MEPIYADPEKSRLKGPFRIYENFRNVYKGVRKNASNKGSYAFDGGGGIVHGHHASSSSTDGVPDPGGGGGTECRSLEASARPSAAAAVVAAGSPSKRSSNDGNSSGSDSGIDSFSDNNASPEPNAENGSLKRRNVWKRDLIINDVSAPGARRGDRGDVQLTAVKSKVKETVLAIEQRYSDVAPVYSKVNKVSHQAATKAPSSKELKELSKMLNDTGDLLSRNSNLRASLTITMKKRTKGGGATKTTTTILLPTPKLDRKKSRVVEIEEPIDDVAAVPRNESTASSKEEKVEEVPSQQLTSPPQQQQPEPEKSPFVRHNPARKPTARRSMRLAPKTVLALANKFDSLLPCETSSESTAPKSIETGSASAAVKESKPAKTKDISSIISALNKLDEEASKDTAVLRRSLRRAALQKARVERKMAKGEVDAQESVNSKCRPCNQKRSRLTTRKGAHNYTAALPLVRCILLDNISDLRSVVGSSPGRGR